MKTRSSCFHPQADGKSADGLQPMKQNSVASVSQTSEVDGD